MAARVHDAAAFRAILGLHEFRDRQRVHVGAQQSDGTGPSAAQRPEHAGFSDARPDVVEAEFLEFGRHERGRLVLDHREFGPAMQKAADAHEVVGRNAVESEHDLKFDARDADTARHTAERREVTNVGRFSLRRILSARQHRDAATRTERTLL